MDETRNASGLSRRTVLIAAAGVAPVLALTTRQAQAKLAQTAVKYQTTPKDGHKCDGCVQFVNGLRKQSLGSISLPYSKASHLIND